MAKSMNEIKNDFSEAFGDIEFAYAHEDGRAKQSGGFINTDGRVEIDGQDYLDMGEERPGKPGALAGLLNLNFKRFKRGL